MHSKLLLLAFVISCFILKSNASTYYVSNQGDDSNIGTNTLQPFRTIDHINTLFLAPGDSVLFRSGDRFIGELIINNSGNSTATIYIGSYGSGDMPEFIGGDSLSNWSLYQGSIYRAYSSDLIKLLIVDNEQQMLARHPNADWFYLDIGVPGTDLIDTDRIGDPDWTGATLLIMNNDWSLNPYDALSFNSLSGEFVVGTSVLANSPNHVEYCIVDHLNALDSPGEWYQDPLTDSVYLWTFDGLNPDSNDVVGATLNNGIYIYGNYVKVEGLKINCYGHSGIRFNNRHHIEIVSNEVRNVKKHGIYPLFGYSHQIVNNRVTNMGHFGIVGYDSPYSVIIANEISNIGLYRNISEEGLQTSKGTGIRFSGDSILIEKNNLSNIGYNGIHFKGSDCLIQNNVIKYFSKTTWDSGAIYGWNQHYDSIGSAGTVIRRNIIIGGLDNINNKFPDNRKAFGLYADDRLHNILIHDNFVANTFVGVFLHNTRFVSATNNELYNNWDNDIRLTTDAIVTEGDMYGNTVNSNRMFRTDTARNNFGIKCRWSTWDLGVYDSNYFYQPYYDTVVNFSYRPDDINEELYTYNLADWRSFSGNDLNSFATPFQWPQNLDYSMYVTNETDSMINFPLNGSWIGFDSVIYNGSIELNPYSGRVLWQFEDCNNEVGGEAFIDSCAICAGGTTGQLPILDPELCDLSFSENKANELKVYPNPVADELILSVGDNLLGTQYILMDNSGRVVFQDHLKYLKNKIDLSGFDRGIYFISTQVGDKHVKIIRM